MASSAAFGFDHFLPSNWVSAAPRHLAPRPLRISGPVDAMGQPIKLEAGQEYDFKIIKMNQDEKKVGLSLRAVGEEASRADVEAYKQPVSSSTTTLGDLVNWKRLEHE